MKDYQVNALECPLWAIVACVAPNHVIVAMAAVLCALSATLALLGHITERRKKQTAQPSDA